MATGYILNEGDAQRLREMNNEVSDLTSGRLVGRRNRRAKRSAGEAGDTYAGQFAITDNGDDTLDIAAGVAVNGLINTTVAAETSLSVTGNTHVSLEIWYNTTWKTAYLTGSSFPGQGVKDDGGTDFPCLRVLIAQKVDDVWSQQQHGAIYNVRVA